MAPETKLEIGQSTSGNNFQIKCHSYNIDLTQNYNKFHV